MPELEQYTITHRFIPEIEVAGKPLGRHVHHDSRSLRYQITADGTVASAKWERLIPILDQGNLGSCTGNAMVGLLGTAPAYAALAALLSTGLKLDENEAITIYSDAEIVDGGVGLPSEDQGSSGLSVAQVAKTRGLISGYTHATSLAAAQTAIQKGPFAVGSNWYTSMDSPTSEGIVSVSGSVRGGHEYECNEYDAQRDLWWLDNSWGLGFGVQGRFAYSSASFSRLLSEQGDVTQITPLNAPAPVPGPQPGPTPNPGPTPDKGAILDQLIAGIPHNWENHVHLAGDKAVAHAIQTARAALGLPR